NPTEEEVRRIGAFGKGTVQILERRSDKSIKFRVTVSWNPEYPAGIERYERWLGLLQIPEIWGSLDGKYRLTTVPVYAEPRSNANPIGTLQNWMEPFFSNERPYAGTAQFHPANAAAEPRDLTAGRRYAEAAGEFQKILDHRGLVGADPISALAH